MDSIVEEIYKAREEIARASGYDLEKISRAAAKRELTRGVKLVTPSGSQKYRAAMAAKADMGQAGQSPTPAAKRGKTQKQAATPRTKAQRRASATTSR